MKRIENQQILDAGNDRDTLSGERSRQHDIVVTVATNWFDHGRDYQRERLLEQPNGSPHIDGALTKLSREDIAKFVQQRLGRNHQMLSNAVLDQIGADAPRDERGDEHVRTTSTTSVHLHRIGRSHGRVTSANTRLSMG